MEASPTLSEEDHHLLEEDGLRDFEVTLRISSTPIPHITLTQTSPGESIEEAEDDGHSTVSLTSSRGGSPEVGGVVGWGRWGKMAPSTTQSPPQDEVEARDFLAYRDSILNHVLDEVKGCVGVEDGALRGSWLLTEIDSWNHELERLVLLCDKALVIFKYDFIKMRVEDWRRLELRNIDKIVHGELAYPSKSLTPKISGIAEGIAGVVKDYIIPSVHGTVHSVGCVIWRKSKCSTAEEPSSSSSSSSPPEDQGVEEEKEVEEKKKSIRGTMLSALSLDKFESKKRKCQGVQLIWNEHEPLSFNQRWNPFDKSIPRLTLTSHPLFWYKGGGGGCGSSSFFDVDVFSKELMDALGQGFPDDLSPSCRVEFMPILIESYAGFSSIFHNSNSLGFYKVRGKVSF